MKFLALLVTYFTLISIPLNAQDMKTTDLPYYQIPDYPEKYTAGSVAARMVDGLGFRYYWATEGLRDVDLHYKPSDKGRTSSETIDHIYGLSNVILNATKMEINDFTIKKPVVSYKEKRQKTLENLKEASDILKVADADEMKKFMVVFKSSNGTREYPFWNNINGPIADGIWHCGQIVLLRRASGNPFNSKASVFSGKLND